MANDRWRVPEAKLRDYLLDLDHPDGGPKAVFFRKLGFSRDRWRELATALVDHLILHGATASRSDHHGTRIVAECGLPPPARPEVCVRSVWIVRAGEGGATFVTAYPR